MNRMSFSETVFLFILALVIFGPKKLPEIARMVGKYMNEFRRASNEFKAQIEQEIAHLDVEDKKKTILPPSAPVQGTASRTLSSPDVPSTPAENATVEPPATLASTGESHPSSGNGAQGNGTHPPAATEALAPTEPVTSPTSQESHV